MAISGRLADVDLAPVDEPGTAYARHEGMLLPGDTIAANALWLPMHRDVHRLAMSKPMRRARALAGSLMATAPERPAKKPHQARG